MKLETEICAGDVAVFNVTARTAFKITHDGWTLKVECTNGEPAAKCNHNGTIQIISVGGNHDDEL